MKQIPAWIFFFNLHSAEELRTKSNHLLPCNSPLSVPVPRDNPFHQFLFWVFLMFISLIRNNIISWFNFVWFLPTTSWKIRNMLILPLSFHSTSLSIGRLFLCSICGYLFNFTYYNCISASRSIILDSLSWILVYVEWSWLFPQPFFPSTSPRLHFFLLS